MSELTNYITADGYDLSYVFHPINDIPAVGQNLTFSGNNTFSGTNTFSGNSIFSELRISCGTISSSPVTLGSPIGSPILNFYQITQNAITINLPNLGTNSPQYSGTFIIFKHTGTGSIIINTDAVVAVGGVGAVTSLTMTNARVVMVSCNGSAWWVSYYTS